MIVSNANLLRVMLVLASFSTAESIQARHKPKLIFYDFSQKGADYLPLEDLRFRADHVIYRGKGQIAILGKQYETHDYTVEATVKVQTMCAMGAGYSATYQWAPAFFDVQVVDDKDRSIHDAFTLAMYRMQHRKEFISDESSYLFTRRQNAYSITALHLSSDADNISYDIWLNGRVARVAFRAYKDSQFGGMGVLDSFNTDHLRMQLADTQVPVWDHSLQVDRTFLRLYEQGFFNPVSRPPAAAAPQ